MENKISEKHSNKVDFSIGIFGGTFNPIHNGHIKIANNVLRIFNLEKIIFIPVGKAPHKDNNEIVSAEHRLNMVKLAILDNGNFQIDPCEINRADFTYTIDTLNYLINKYPNRSLKYLIGSDVLFDLLTWKDFENVFNLCEFIVFSRIGFANNQINDRISFLEKNYRARIHLVNIPNIEISSSEIRGNIKKLKNNFIDFNFKYENFDSVKLKENKFLDLTEYLPDAVLDYILKNKLYYKS